MARMAMATCSRRERADAATVVGVVVVVAVAVVVVVAVATTEPSLCDSAPAVDATALAVSAGLSVSGAESAPRAMSSKASWHRRST